MPVKTTVFFFFFLLLTLFTFAQSENKPKKSIFHIKLAAVKSPKGIDITITSPQFTNFTEVIVERSNSLTGVYRQIKVIYHPDLEKAINEITFKDEFPPNIQNANYYRLRVITIYGTLITYPGVEEESYISFNKDRQKNNASNIESKAITHETTNQVDTLFPPNKDKKFEQATHTKTSTFAQAMKETTLRIAKPTDTTRTLIIGLPQYQQIDTLVILIHHERNKRYFTLKSMSREEIARRYNDGSLDYSIHLKGLDRPLNSYHLKLQLIHANEKFETAPKAID